MRLSNGFVIDKEKTFGELKFTAVRDVFLQNEDGTPSTQLKKRIYDLKCSLHGGIIPVSVPPEVPLREFPYNAVVELVNSPATQYQTAHACRLGAFQLVREWLDALPLQLHNHIDSDWCLCIGRFSILPLLLRQFQEAPAPSKAGTNDTGKQVV